MIVSPGASMPPGGLMKQLFGAVVWNYKTNDTWIKLVFHLKLLLHKTI
jgi:hypothetical protein